LNDFQHLSTLGYRIVVSVQNLHFRPKTMSSFGGRCRLLTLVTVIVWKGYDKAELLQGSPPWHVIAPTIPPMLARRK
jgi:hypothetical protein